MDHRPTPNHDVSSRAEPAPRDLTADFARIFATDGQMPGDISLELLGDYRSKHRTEGTR